MAKKRKTKKAGTKPLSQKLMMLMLQSQQAQQAQAQMQMQMQMQPQQSPQLERAQMGQSPPPTPTHADRGDPWEILRLKQDKQSQLLLQGLGIDMNDPYLPSNETVFPPSLQGPQVPQERQAYYNSGQQYAKEYWEKQHESEAPQRASAEDAFIEEFYQQQQQRRMNQAKRPQRMQ